MMKSIRIAALAVATTALAACQATPVSKPSIWQSVDFVRGCWISRANDGAVSTLRLLPSRTSAALLDGYLQDFEGKSITGSIYVAVAQSGSHVVVAGPTDPKSAVPNGTFGRVAHPVWFTPRYADSASFQENSGRLISLQGDEENLRISWTGVQSGDALIHIVLFEGRRDGCD